MVMSSNEGPRSSVGLQHPAVLFVCGILAGIGIGFVYGLIKPRARA